MLSNLPRPPAPPACWIHRHPLLWETIVTDEADDTPALRTSETDPIRVAQIPADRLPARGRLGLTIAPGKKGPSQHGSPWRRSLTADLIVLERDFDTGVLVSLIEDHEFGTLGIRDLTRRASAHGMVVLHLPIRDVSVPKPQDVGVFDSTVGRIQTHLMAGENVVLHCRGGLGRSGLVAACVLVAFGMDAYEAIRVVRQVRPGAVENADQERYVHDYAQRRKLD